MKTHTEKGVVTYENSQNKLIHKSGLWGTFFNFLLLFAVLALFVYLRKKYFKNRKELLESQEKTKEIKEHSKRKLPTIKELVNSVLDIESYRKLQEKAKEIEYKYQNEGYESDVYDDKLEKENDIYNEASDRAGQKEIFIQYIPNIDLESTEIEIENAYKIFFISEKKEKIKEFGCSEYEMESVDIYSYLEKDYEKRPKYFSQLIEYQKIINNKDLSFEERIKKINNMSRRDNDFNKEFNYHRLKMGDEWAKDQLITFGVPKVDRLFEMGFNTPDNIMQMNIDSFKDEKGFGPDTLKKLKVAIENIKKQYNK